MLILRDIPNPTDENCWEYAGGERIGQSKNYIVWPTDDGPKLVRVKINVTALSDYIAGDGLGMNPGKIEAALGRNIGNCILDLGKIRCYPIRLLASKMIRSRLARPHQGSANMDLDSPESRGNPSSLPRVT
jgi:hypothetical protein